jgi:hypothetical protein
MKPAASTQVLNYFSSRAKKIPNPQEVKKNFTISDTAEKVKCNARWPDQLSANRISSYLKPSLSASKLFCYLLLSGWYREMTFSHGFKS